MGRNLNGREYQKKMESNKRECLVYVFIGVILIVISDCQHAVFGLPVPPLDSVTFYDKLYQNASEANCALLPKVSSVDRNYTRSMINQLCDLSEREGEVDSVEMGASLCNSLMDVFSKICSSYNSSVVNPNANKTMNLKQPDILQLTSVCSTIKEVIGNVSRRGKVVSPFAVGDTAPAQGKDNSCMSLCKNSGNIREGFNEYSKLNAHPACLILLEGYKVYSTELSRLDEKIVVTKRVNNSTKGNIQGDPSKTTGNEGAEIETKPTNTGLPVAGVQEANIQQVTKEEVGDIKATIPTVALKKETSLESVTIPEKSASANPTKTQLVSEDHAESIPQKPQQLDGVKDPKLHKETGNLDHENGKTPVVITNNAKSSTTSTSTTTTIASVEVDNEEAMPVVNSANKGKSSTAIPKGDVDTAFAEVNKEQSKTKDNKTSVVNKEEVDNKLPVDQGKSLSKPSKPAKKTEENDNMLQMPDIAEDDGADYTPEEDLNNDNGIDLRKPSKLTGGNKEVEIPQPEIQNMGYESDNSFKPPVNRVSGNEFREDFDFRDTTINVSLKESEDTGFFSYFLFCVTLVGVMYLVVHNKKKLIAYVVEGKRPRSRSRRASSSSGQYRRLENNYD